MFQKKTKVFTIASLLMTLTVALSVFLSGTTFALPTAKTNNTYNGKAPKYVFLFIGDGMSYAQISATEMYLGNQQRPKNPQIKALDFTNFPVSGIVSTFDAQSFIPDSASTGTSIASGIKTNDGIINMNPEKTVNVEPITRKLKAKGYKIGVVTSVSIDHATPAVFYANEPSRNNYYNIGMQLAKSNFDYFAGGSLLDIEGKNSKLEKPENIIEAAKKNGFKVVNTKEEILGLNSSAGKVLAINPILDGAALPYEIDRKADDLSLADFVRKGVDVLDNKDGFFMMVEGGKIDWACHANDAATSIHDTIAFNHAIKEAIKVYEKYPNDTLILVTGDHETGGMTIGFAGTGYETFFEKLEKQTMSYVEFDKIIGQYKKATKLENARLEDLLPQIKSAFGLITSKDPDAEKNKSLVLTDTDVARLRDALKRTMMAKEDRNYSDQEKILYGTYEPLSVTLTHILNNKAGISFTTYSHSGSPVPVYAIGVGSELFMGAYDNTDINKKLKAITKVQ